MKKLLALCAFALTTGYGQAQTTAGRMMIGGNVGYTKQKNEDVLWSPHETKRFIINPQFGFFIADHLAVGLQVDYTDQRFTRRDVFTSDEVEYKSTSTTLSPFVRYYIFTPNEKFAFYVQAMAGVGFLKNDVVDSPDPVKGRAISAQLSPGFSYFFTEKWVLDLQLNGISYASYDWNTDSDAKNDKTTVLTFGVSSLNPALGFRYFIGN